MRNVKLTICLGIDKDSIETFKKFAHHIEYLFHLGKYPEIIEISSIEMEEIPNDTIFSTTLKTDMFLAVKDNAEELLEKFIHHIEYLIDLDNDPSSYKVQSVSYQFVD